MALIVVCAVIVIGPAYIIADGSGFVPSVV